MSWFVWEPRIPGYLFILWTYVFAGDLLNDALLLLAYPLYDKSGCGYPLEYDCLTCGMGCFILRAPITLVGEKWNVFVWADCSCIVSTCQFHSCMMICPLGVRYFCTYTSLVNPTIEMLHHGHVHDSFIYPEKPFRPRSKYCCWPQTFFLKSLTPNIATLVPLGGTASRCPGHE